MSSAEPKFISQNGENLSPDETREWFRECAREAEEQGAVFHRFTAHPTIVGLILHEGWTEQPQEQGEPRFMLQAGERA
jgi:hypothetical protein